MHKIRKPGMINLDGWLTQATKTIKHIEQQQDSGYFFEKDIADVKNSLTQAKLSCRRMDEWILRNEK